MPTSATTSHPVHGLSNSYTFKLLVCLIEHLPIVWFNHIACLNASSTAQRRMTELQYNYLLLSAE